MATATETPGLPDYVTDENAVLKDEANWRYGRAPDYSKTRAVWKDGKWPARAQVPAQSRGTAPDTKLQAKR